nr:hypothetical protein [uncultured Kingella sp.]
MPTRFQAAFQYGTRGQQVPTLLQGNLLFSSENVVSHTRQPESAWAKCPSYSSKYRLNPVGWALVAHAFRTAKAA